MTRDSHKIKQGENYCHGNCVNLVWMLYLGMRGTSVLNIDCYWLNERVCVNCPLVRAVTDTCHLSVSLMMCWLQLDTWAQDAVWCGPLVTELPALKSLKRIPELWIIITSNTPTYKLIQLWNHSDLPCLLCSHHRIIMKFSGVITNDLSEVHAKGYGQRSKVKVREVKTKLNRLRTIIPISIHIWWWNDAQSLMLHRRGALLFFKVNHRISRSNGTNNQRLWPELTVSEL